MYWDDEIMETKSQEKVGGEVSNEKPFQKISKQLINQLSKLRGRFDAKPKKGRGFIALLEDIYFEIGSPGLRSKINKISEAMKWSGLREVSISLRQRKSAMINAWRRVAWLCRELVIMADLVERAEEAFAALDRLLEALKLLAVGTNLKQEFERLDGGGDTELNQEGGGGGQAGQLANEEPFDFAAFVNVLDIFGMNQLSFRLANVSVKPSMVGEARILFRAMRKAVADNKHEVHGGIWDPKQSRKFEMTEAISEFVKAKDSNGSMDRLLGFLDEFNRSNRFDMVRKFADQVDIYRDDPREDVHELWRKFMEGIDWIHRLNCGRKLLQFIQLLHRLLPKYTEMNRLKAEDQREQLEEEMFWAEEEETVPTPAAAEGAARGDGEANNAKNRVLRAFATLELETIYKNIKEKMLAQFEGWWKRVPEQKEPLYEFFKQLEDISTRYVMAIVDAFFDGISIESFRQEYSLGVKDVKVNKTKDQQRPIAENERTIHPNQNVGSDTEQTAKISANDKTPTGVIGETNAFFDHFSADQHNLFDKESNRFNLNIFIQTFDKSLQITKFLTIGLASVFKWRKRFLSELAESAANELNEFDGFMYFFETGNSGSAKKRKFRKPLPPVLSKQTLKTIVKVIRVYEMKFRHNNISQMSDQKILDVHWRKVREAQEKAKIAKQKTAEDEQSSSSASLSRTSSNEAVGEQWLRMLSMEGDEVPMDERERKESLDKIEALVKAKRLLLFAIILRQKYARIERKNAKSAAEVVVNSEPIDAAYFELLRDIRRETERWVPRQREIKRLYRVCRNLNRAERVEIGKLVDAFLRGQSVDNFLESQTTKRDKKRGAKAP
ncbi:hypothetical protein niasHT_035517 [Heterodera trifolii]|uniref:Uncharacterized protein n=1 Tax=Heterodera trifolii TaxID=157864 RepID=A0ABD2IQ45_9BILA